MPFLFVFWLASGRMPLIRLGSLAPAPPAPPAPALPYDSTDFCPVCGAGPVGSSGQGAAARPARLGSPLWQCRRRPVGSVAGGRAV